MYHLSPDQESCAGPLSPLEGSLLTHPFILTGSRILVDFEGTVPGTSELVINLIPSGSSSCDSNALRSLPMMGKGQGKAIEVAWPSKESLLIHRGRVVRLAFELKATHLFGFQIKE